MSGVRKNTSACMACSGSATINTKCQSEFGPEWTKVGDTGCGSCRFNGLVIGRRATCQHSSYQGNTLSCCLGNGSGGDNKTCDPNWSINTGGCDAAMATYCSSGDYAAKHPKCLEWRNARPAQAKATVINTIKRNNDLLADDDYQSFAIKMANSGDPSLDAEVTTFCKKNPDNKLCTCINSKALTTLGINPKCVDSKCLATGYLTANQASTACPDIVSCTQINNLETAGVSLLTSIKTSQSCGNTTNPTNPTTGSGSGSSTGTNPSDSFEFDDPSNTTLILLIIITFIMFMVLAGVYVLMGDDNNNIVSAPSYYTDIY